MVLIRKELFNQILLKQ